ncbi:MAG TPA: aminotransferase class I/II-fold pyridoxal phosphate-dependent enzyme [Gemmataceae bacterium]|nr:aminotransferase class I/II-fold pyridoxal phosphate-dependent enzyme [Gemmataceae bacterium]
MNPEAWISDRSKKVELSGIRKVFELGRSLKDPVNLSIGQPHFPVPKPIREAAKAAIDAHHNGYTVTQGIAPLHERLTTDARTRFPGSNREVLVTSGTSGGLLLALLAVVNPGDEVVTADPYFVAYPHMVTMAGGKLVTVDTYPDFRIDPDKIAAAITPRTKAILLSTPSNPTGAVIDADTQKALAKLARDRGVLLISDEIYRAFQYDSPRPHSRSRLSDAPASSPAAFDENVLVVEGFGKTYGITGWRIGWAHGPKVLVNEMAKLQQCTFVCAPSMVQHASLAALDFDVSEIVADYRRKRDAMTAALKDKYEIAPTGGAFYLFPKAPWGTATEFVEAAIKNNLLIIPGGTFSRRDTHFRVSYAASDETLSRGIDILRKMATR